MVSLGLIYRSLDSEALRVLYAIEQGMKRHEYVPVDYIAKATKIPPKRLDTILSFLNSKKIIRRRVGYTVGYKLVFLGLDMLAIDNLVKRGVLAAIGEKIGVGKESDIYEALNPAQERLALKLHRIGRTSFKKTKRVRPYVFERESPDWLSESKLSAQREFRALQELSTHTKYVPKPVAHNRHAVVTEFIEGIELYRVKSLENPGEVLEGIIEVIKVAYNEVGIVHGDLSEYNILVSYPEEKPIVIDWPQYLYRDYPQAVEALKRDVYYVVRYFNKRFSLNVDWKSVIDEILSEERV